MLGLAALVASFVWVFESASPLNVWLERSASPRTHPENHSRSEQTASASSHLAKGIDEPRTEPANLGEQLALEEARGGAGERIMEVRSTIHGILSKIGAKKEHVHRGQDDSRVVVHYWERLGTGVREGFKFK